MRSTIPANPLALVRVTHKEPEDPTGMPTPEDPVEIRKSATLRFKEAELDLSPLVPVTVIVYNPAWVLAKALLKVETVRVVEPDPDSETATCPPKASRGPFETCGDSSASKSTVPEKPLVLSACMMYVPVDPGRSDREAGLGERVKPGSFANGFWTGR